MPPRFAPEFSKLDGESHSQARGGRRRGTWAAFFTGAALFVGSAAVVISQGAFARGPGMSIFGAMGAHFQPGFEAYADPHFIVIPLAPYPSPRGNHRRRISAGVAGAPASFARRREVCVRLCDGFFFPASSAASSGDEASCASQCPDAPTATFSIPPGSDRIEDAISALGERYSALPVALRYRTTRDSTCTCHRAVASDFSPLRDPTLRRGDAVMTERGLLVFQGAEQPNHAPKDFAALATVALPREQRVALRELERANAAPLHGVSRSWTVAQGPSWTLRPTHSLLAAATPSPRPVSGNSQIRFVEKSAASTD